MPLALPTATKYTSAANISANNRIVYTSLLGVQQAFLYALKEFLKAKGWTVKGSCSAGTAAMDGVDRWAAAANVTPRGANAASSQAWIVLTGALGQNVFIAFQGTTDSRAQMGYSTGGNIVLAGTANNQPTATDMVSFFQNQDTISPSATTDTIYNIWATSDDFRFATLTAGAYVGTAGGCEVITPTDFGGNVTYPLSYFGFAKVNPGGFVSANLVALSSASNGQSARVTVSSAPLSGFVEVVMPQCSGIGSNAYGASVQELQSVQYGLQELTLAQVQNTSWRGKLGTIKDWYLGKTSTAIGDTYGSGAWIAVGDCAWPWDNSTQVLS